MTVLEHKVDLLLKYITSDDPVFKEEVKTEICKYVNPFDRGVSVDIVDDRLDHMIEDLMLEIGVPQHLMGYEQIIYAIKLIYSDTDYVKRITGKLYPAVAERFNSKNSRIERNIRHAIDSAWSRCDLEIVMPIFGNTIDPNRGKPTVAEFLAVCASTIHRRMRDI